RADQWMATASGNGEPPRETLPGTGTNQTSEEQTGRHRPAQQQGAPSGAAEDKARYAGTFHQAYSGVQGPQPSTAEGARQTTGSGQWTAQQRTGQARTT